MEAVRYRILSSSEGKNKGDSASYKSTEASSYFNRPTAAEIKGQKRNDSRLPPKDM